MTADFAASAAMANDILALNTDDQGAITAPAPPPPPTVAETPKPRPVPDLDLEVPFEIPTWTSESPMAPDFFITSSRSKAKRKPWKTSR